MTKLHVKEGERVMQHQLLLEVWNDDLKDQAKLQNAQVTANRANAEQACQLGANAEREAHRISKLFNNKHIVSEEAVDSKVSIAKSKQAACNAALENITVSERSHEAALASVQRTLLFAPFDGTIAEINAELGEYVTPSPPGIPTLPPIDLMDISCLYVSAPIDEVDAPQIKTGMTACVSLDAFAEKRCSGKVSRIAPYVCNGQVKPDTFLDSFLIEIPFKLQRGLIT